MKLTCTVCFWSDWAHVFILSAPTHFTIFLRSIDLSFSFLNKIDFSCQQRAIVFIRYTKDYLFACRYNWISLLVFNSRKNSICTRARASFLHLSDKPLGEHRIVTAKKVLECYSTKWQDNDLSKPRESKRDKKSILLEGCCDFAGKLLQWDSF